MNSKLEPEDEVLAGTNLCRITESEQADIFVAGYPKSGNTWVQHLLGGLVFGLDVRVAPDSLLHDLVPDVHYKEFYRRYLTPTFFKTHELPQPRHRRVVFLVRDGRDVMVSYFHYLNALGNTSDFSKLVATGEGLFPCRWHEHIEAWMANPYGADMITISYEMLKRDTVKALQMICDFAGIKRERTTFELAARNASFENLREKEKKFRPSNSIWPKDKFFMRRGEVNSYRDEMPEAVLQVFMKQSEPALKRLGYL